MNRANDSCELSFIVFICGRRDEGKTETWKKKSKWKKYFKETWENCILCAFSFIFPLWLPMRNSLFHINIHENISYRIYWVLCCFCAVNVHWPVHVPNCWMLLCEMRAIMCDFKINQTRRLVVEKKEIKKEFSATKHSFHYVYRWKFHSYCLVISCFAFTNAVSVWRFDRYSE